jgi:hypothetical protein
VQYKNELACALGDVLHGAVELQLERSIDVDRMTVTFYGEVTYSFRGERHSRQFERQRQVRAHRSHTYAGVAQDLWRTPTTLGSRLQPGLYVYEFFVGTRTDLPSAFIAKSGSIHSLMYYCEVRPGRQRQHTCVDTYHRAIWPCAIGGSGSHQTAQHKLAYTAHSDGATRRHAQLLHQRHGHAQVRAHINL